MSIYLENEAEQKNKPGSMLKMCQNVKIWREQSSGDFYFLTVFPRLGSYKTEGFDFVRVCFAKAQHTPYSFHMVNSVTCIDGSCAVIV